MTSRALLIHRICCPGHEAFGSRLMHPVAFRTGNAASGVAALNASDMNRLIAMAGKAGLIDSRRGQLRGVDDGIGGGGVDVGAGRAVTSFARMVFPTALLVGIDSFVWILLKRVEYVFMTGLAAVRANIGLSSSRGGARGGSGHGGFRFLDRRRCVLLRLRGSISCGWLRLLRPGTEPILALARSIRPGRRIEPGFPRSIS